MVRFIKKHIPIKIKAKLRYFIDYLFGGIKNSFMYIIPSKNKFILFGTPYHDNLGDHSIAFAEYGLIANNFDKCAPTSVAPFLFGRRTLAIHTARVCRVDGVARECSRVLACDLDESEYRTSRAEQMGVC